MCWKEYPLRMWCLGGDCCFCLFGCCLLPPWSLEKETRSGCWWSTPGFGLWGEGLTAAHRQLPSPRWQDPHHKCCFHQQDRWVLSELRVYLCLLPFQAHPVPLCPPSRSIYLSDFICTKHHISLKSGSWGYSYFGTCYNYTPKAWLYARIWNSSYAQWQTHTATRSLTPQSYL